MSISLTNPFSTFLAVAGLLTYLAASIISVVARPLAGFGLLFFAIASIPEPLLVPQYSYFGYRAVLPLLGIGLGLADAMSWFISRKRFITSFNYRLLYVGVGFVAVLFFMARTGIEMAEVWKDPVRFWSRVAESIPETGERLEAKLAFEVYYSLGQALQFAGRNDEAVLYYSKAPLTVPDGRNVYGALGSAFLKVGDTEKAETFLKQSLAVSPNDSTTLGNMEHLRIKQGRIDEAQTYFEKAVEHTPFSARAHYNLGIHFLNCQRLNEAGEHLAKAIRLNPTFGEAYGELGAVHAMLGNLIDAIPNFRKALQISPSDEITRGYLETALIQLRDEKGNSRPPASEEQLGRKNFK